MTPEISVGIDKAFLEAGAIYDTAGPKDRLSTLITQAIRQAENEAIERAAKLVDELRRHDYNSSGFNALWAASDHIRSLATKDP